MKKRRIIIISTIIISVFLIIFGYRRYLRKKCYLKVPSGVLIFQFTGKILSGIMDDNCSAEIEIRRAPYKYWPITTQLITGSTGCWYQNFCPSIVRNKNQIIAFNEFYSSNCGKSFVRVYKLLKKIKAEYDLKLHGTIYLHLNKGILTVSNDRTNFVFTSEDDGKTFEKHKFKNRKLRRIFNHSVKNGE